jgi:hypothetical protein
VNSPFFNGGVDAKIIELNGFFHYSGWLPDDYHGEFSIVAFLYRVYTSLAPALNCSGQILSANKPQRSFHLRVLYKPLKTLGFLGGWFFNRTTITVSRPAICQQHHEVGAGLSLENLINPQNRGFANLQNGWTSVLINL